MQPSRKKSREFYTHWRWPHCHRGQEEKRREIIQTSTASTEKARILQSLTERGPPGRSGEKRRKIIISSTASRKSARILQSSSLSKEEGANFTIVGAKRKKNREFYSRRRQVKKKGANFTVVLVIINQQGGLGRTRVTSNLVNLCF